MNKKGKKKISYSKIIFTVTAIMTIAVTVFTLIHIWRTMDSTPLCYLIPAVFTEMATATGFYYRKAEKENTKGGITYDSAMTNINNQNLESEVISDGNINSGQSEN